MKILRMMLLIIVLLAGVSGLFAEEEAETDEYHWAGGLSVIAPGMPVAAKVVYQDGGWGWQGEFNYFLMLGEARLDGRRIIRGEKGTDLYAFAGFTLNHFNQNYNAETPTNLLEFIFSADAGVGAEWRFTKHLGIGAEGGLLIPLWQNNPDSDYTDSGIMVANLYVLWWF